MTRLPVWRLGCRDASLRVALCSKGGLRKANALAREALRFAEGMRGSEAAESTGRR